MGVFVPIFRNAKKVKDYYANLNTNASPVITASFIHELKFQSALQ